jgi:DNA/RNA-binding domain of Phe-tRNA-synthetase-like protein
MSFAVAEECVALGLRAGAVIFRGVRVEPAAPAALKTLIATEVEAIRGRFGTTREVWALPEVLSFEEVLRKVGVNPRRERPSVGRLLSFALERGTLPAINSLVDTYNVVSVRSQCSLGAHDLDRIALPVALRLLSGTESFTPLGSVVEIPVAAGEFGYVDAAGRVLCRLDVRQADFSKVTPATRNALLIIEGTTGHAPATIQQAFDEAIELITRHCGGSAEVVAFPGR